MQKDYTSKTNRQLRAIRNNNAPNSTAWFINKERAQAAHRAAYAEIQRRKNA